MLNFVLLPSIKDHANKNMITVIVLRCSFSVVLCYDVILIYFKRNIIIYFEFYDEYLTLREVKNQIYLHFYLNIMAKHVK